MYMLASAKWCRTGSGQHQKDTDRIRILRSNLIRICNTGNYTNSMLTTNFLCGIYCAGRLCKKQISCLPIGCTITGRKLMTNQRKASNGLPGVCQLFMEELVYFPLLSLAVSRNNAYQKTIRLPSLLLTSISWGHYFVLAFFTYSI
jgi:hypothetical protein